MQTSLVGWVLVRWRSLVQRITCAGWSAYYTLYLRLHPGVSLAGGLMVSGRVIWKIDPRSRMELGRNVRIHSGARVNAYGGHRPAIICVLPGGRLTIGDGAGISSSTIICQARIEIGERVMVGGASSIFDTDFHPVNLTARDAHDPANVKVAPVNVQPGAWIGGNVIIGKGVTVGSQAVIGAGSVVVKSVPAREIWGGNPAQRIGIVASTG